MDFHQLLNKLKTLDTPAVESQLEGGCGAMPGDMPPSLPPISSEPPPPPPSMSINLNAHGMDDIESMMKLLTKVNPDMMPKVPEPMPSLNSPMSMPMGGITPLKMLPDLSDEPHSEPDADNMGGPSDMDADNMPKDMDGDDDEKKEDGGFQGSSTKPQEKYSDVDDVMNKIAGGMNNPNQGTYPKVSGGDNPMQKVKQESDLRSQIRAELLQRLAEAKGAK
jgi:hypothetical protein